MNKLIISLLTASLLAGCGVYSKYERPQDLPTTSLYNEQTMSQTDTTSIADLRWQNFYTDPKLQALISTALVSNNNFRATQLRIAQSEAQLSAARKAFLPSLALAPQASLSSLDGAKAIQSYQLPLTASWQVDIFGSIRNAKKRAEVALLNSQVYKQAVQSQLIASVANAYYTLTLLDAQIEVSRQAISLARESVRTMQAMMQAGTANDAAVSSSEANLAQQEASLLGLEQQRRAAEGSLNLLLGRTQVAIDRDAISSWVAPQQLSVGLPIRLLNNRPDVRQAELALASSFYATNAARAAFYPSLTLSGSLGWTNNGGTLFTDPAKVLASAVASIVQPIFQRGQLTANLKVAKAQQEEAQLAFVQSLLSAGNEVNTRFSEVQTYKAQAQYLRQRTEALKRAEKATRLLMQSGASTYLEVLTAQQSLLAAQLAEYGNQYNEIASTIALYQALGGGIKD